MPGARAYNFLLTIPFILRFDQWGFVTCFLIFVVEAINSLFALENLKFIEKVGMSRDDTATEMSIQLISSVCEIRWALHLNSLSSLHVDNSELPALNRVEMS